MAKHKHIINLSEVPLEKINAPDGSVFGGTRRQVGAQEFGEARDVAAGHRLAESLQQTGVTVRCRRGRRAFVAQ